MPKKQQKQKQQKQQKQTKPTVQQPPKEIALAPPVKRARMLNPPYGLSLVNQYLARRTIQVANARICTKEEFVRVLQKYNLSIPDDL